MLVCVDGTWSPVACAGPKGCVAGARFVDCDESLARVGDPCGADAVDNVACSTDGRAMLRCDGKAWAEHRVCRGPKSCTKTDRFVDCDDSLAEVGDPCDEGLRTCSVDGTKLLLCKAGRLAVEDTCTPGKCSAGDDFADCEGDGVDNAP